MPPQAVIASTKKRKEAHADSKADRQLASKRAHNASKSDATITATTGDVFEGSLFTSVTEQDFKGCRITPDKRISVYDAFGAITGKTPKQVRKLFDNIQSRRATSELVSHYKFNGKGQTETPVANFNTIIRLCALLPKKFGRQFRDEQADLQARAIAGDHDLETTLQAQREKLSAATQEVLLQGLKSSNRAKEARSKQHEEEIEKNKRLKSRFETLVTTNKQLIEHNARLNVCNLKTSNSARRLTTQIQELEEFKELSAAATDELIALKDADLDTKDADLQEERRLSLVKGERLQQTEVTLRESVDRLHQTEQDLAAMRAALVHGATVAGDKCRAFESNLQQSVPGHIGRAAVSKSGRYISLKDLPGISRFSNGAQGDTRSRFIRDLNRNTVDSMGQVFAIWGRTTPIPTIQQQRDALMCLVHPSDQEHVPPLSRFRSEQSSVSWRTLIYTVMKGVYDVEHSTCVKLHEQQVLVARFNRWVRDRMMTQLQQQQQHGVGMLAIAQQPGAGGVVTVQQACAGAVGADVMASLPTGAEMLSQAEEDLAALIGPPASVDLLLQDNRPRVAAPSLITHFMQRLGMSGMALIA